MWFHISGRYFHHLHNKELLGLSDKKKTKKAICFINDILLPVLQYSAFYYIIKSTNGVATKFKWSFIF